MRVYFVKCMNGKKLSLLRITVVQPMPSPKKSYERWLAQGKEIGHPIVEAFLKRMHNWQKEICNYHQLYFTNAAVEGKNNKIKTLQRRHYFTRSPECYKQHNLLECNEEWGFNKALS